MHLKRQESPKSWPIYRKGTKYIVRPNSGIQKGIPILIVLRNLLKLAQNRKEVKRAIHLKNIFVNNKPVRDEKNSIFLFDTLKIIPLKKSYRLEILNNGKIGMKEIKEDESNYKIIKVVNKKMLKGKKMQLNMDDGRNLFSDIECKINDSVIINFNEKKIEKCIPLKEDTEVFIFAGKHAGSKGNLIKIDKNKKMAEVNIDKKHVNVLIKQLMAIK
ncbi:MAG: hypothetical protein ABIH65_02455 [Nanoarchaeota archaeon]